MSMIVRKQLNGIKAIVVARLCDLRDIEVVHQNHTYKGYNRIRDLIRSGKMDNFTLQRPSATTANRYERLNLSVVGEDIATSYDSDFVERSNKRISLVDLLFHPRNANAPGDGYMQAATYEQLVEQGCVVTVRQDQLINGQWLVGDLEAEVSEGQSAMAAGSVI